MGEYRVTGIPKHWQAYLDTRMRYLQVRDFMLKQMYKRLPPHTGWAHVFGSLALLTFLNQFITGILLLLYYRPTLKEAHESIQYITGDVPFGWLLPRPGETVFNTGDRMPKIGMSQSSPSRTFAWPRPSHNRQSRVSARVTTIRPLSAPSRRLVGDNNPVASECRFTFVRFMANR